MAYSDFHNVIGAMALALADVVRVGTRGHAPKNITAAAITLVGHDPGLSIQELSNALELSRSGAVRLVDRMVADGIVRRDKSPEDNRMVTLWLTDVGLEKEQATLASRAKSLDDALTALSADEVASLSKLSKKLLYALVRDEATALRVCRLCDSETCIGYPVEAALENAQ